ncbi:zinc-finger homeodomain protein 8 [Brachypodium distachyon]|uniref:ZF-HD dimerization-type domain-containing protein n=1 Tax=Brachypodium distachyon TaxID=15368 RepID=I1IXW0_BRADI|nr:zinc-finger homeodomain protein 8 [Brachypodium distachyon]KQJ82687.1 hypothetical protein BRADI_5g10470v3 [Brachypodium distachyon]|eukprot:XP_003579781.1 zinc-finger homeodomain protein 8 [Brachypodium distachyon]
MMDQLSLVPYEGGSGVGGAGGKYKECMRNHAAAMGGQAFDGCGEYMSASPDSLSCAACGCHRSFHRRQAAGGSLTGSPVFFRPPPPPPHTHHGVLQGFLASAPPPPPQLALPYHAVPTAAWHHGLGLDPAHTARAGSETPPRAEDCSPGSGSGGPGAGAGMFGRKRVRTKFTPEQKEQMRAFAEKQGWRINRDDGGALDRFCLEIGVKRNVLKVWMHNHKTHLASPTFRSSAAAVAAAAGINPVAGAGPGIGITGVGTGDGDDEDTDDSPPRAAVSSPSPSPISV